ncbi:MAG TPA: glycosyltransferase [Mycobacteriales bacterium]|nr:glycosyltransferase [Mycobacteriales bacterium]
MTGRPGLTIGVPTRDRPQQLAELLALVVDEAPALRRRWRVQLVVADGSAQPAELSPAVRAAFDDARVVPVDGGVSSGRNACAAAATGAVLVLVDDDVRPHAESLERLAGAVRPGTVVAGRVHGLGHRPGEASGLMAVARTGYGEPAAPGAAPDYVVSALLALPREVYRRVEWDERFVAAHLDDVMFGLRLRDAGVRLVECDGATADHPPREDNERPELAAQRALVVLTRWRDDRPVRAWARCLAHVAWSHRARPRDVVTAVAAYLSGTRRWAAAP